MALNVKRLEPLPHPDFKVHEHPETVGLYTEGDPVDVQKDWREDTPAQHNLDFQENLLKINIISS